MEHAQVLLLESSMSVTEIAGIGGITWLRYFGKAFRAATAMTPTDFWQAGGWMSSWVQVVGDIFS